MGSVKYRSRANVEPLVSITRPSWLLMIDDGKSEGPAEDATDLSAKYRGCTGLPISVYQSNNKA